MPETLTAEDVAMLREAQERLRDRAATLPIAAPPMPASGAFLRGDAPEGDGELVEGDSQKPVISS